MSRKPHKYWLARHFLVKQLLKMGLYNKMFDLTNSPAKKEANFCLLPQKLFPGRISPRSCKASPICISLITSLPDKSATVWATFTMRS